MILANSRKSGTNLSQIITDKYIVWHRFVSFRNGKRKREFIFNIDFGVILLKNLGIVIEHCARF